jgi:hypothetical protein
MIGQIMVVIMIYSKLSKELERVKQYIERLCLSEWFGPSLLCGYTKLHLQIPSLTKKHTCKVSANK